MSSAIVGARPRVTRAHRYSCIVPVEVGEWGNIEIRMSNDVCRLTNDECDPCCARKRINFNFSKTFLQVAERNGALRTQNYKLDEKYVTCDIVFVSPPIALHSVHALATPPTSRRRSL